VSTNAFLHSARKNYHAALLRSGVLSMTSHGVPSNADRDSNTSTKIARGIFERIQSKAKPSNRLAGQISGSKFEQVTRAFVESAFSAMDGLRPGKWDFNPERRTIYDFEQYNHLAELAAIAAKTAEIAVLLGNDYVIAPDILVLRHPESDKVINAKQNLVDDSIALLTSLRKRNNTLPILHASISCKWTLRSDRAQNARSEALNLIRNRKGRAPHIAVVTGEPLPSRLASIALGTGDLDCVYHFALHELMASVEELGLEDPAQMVKIMVDGKRLKDIADLPLDLAV
jgi:NgoMIV restriction enzyme